MVRSQCVSVCVCIDICMRMCVTVCMYYVCIYVYVCVPLCVCTCGGQRSTSSAVPREPLTLILRLSLSLAVSFRLAGQLAPRRLLSSPLSLQCGDHKCTTLHSIFKCIVGMKCGVLMLTLQALYRLSHLADLDGIPM